VVPVSGPLRLEPAMVGGADVMATIRDDIDRAESLLERDVALRLGPAIALLRSAGASDPWSVLADGVGVTVLTLRRWGRDGLTDGQAVRVSVDGCGVDPEVIWPVLRPVRPPREPGATLRRCGEGPGPAQTPRVPLGPVVEHLRGRGVEWPIAHIARGLDVDRGTVHRWAHDGIPEAQADRLATKVLGVHPSLVWSDWWALSWPDGSSTLGPSVG
jgi:lambda repressor-like predicted transcriptional regulator